MDHYLNRHRGLILGKVQQARIPRAPCIWGRPDAVHPSWNCSAPWTGAPPSLAADSLQSLRQAVAGWGWILHWVVLAIRALCVQGQRYRMQKTWYEKRTHFSEAITAILVDNLYCATASGPAQSCFTKCPCQVFSQCIWAMAKLIPLGRAVVWRTAGGYHRGPGGCCIL